jgi:hypothetical protein
MARTTYRSVECSRNREVRLPRSRRRQVSQAHAIDMPCSPHRRLWHTCEPKHRKHGNEASISARRSVSVQGEDEDRQPHDCPVSTRCHCVMTSTLDAKTSSNPFSSGSAARHQSAQNPPHRKHRKLRTATWGCRPPWGTRACRLWLIARRPA